MNRDETVWTIILSKNKEQYLKKGVLLIIVGWLFASLWFFIALFIPFGFFVFIISLVLAIIFSLIGIYFIITSKYVQNKYNFFPKWKKNYVIVCCVISFFLIVWLIWQVLDSIAG